VRREAMGDGRWAMGEAKDVERSAFVEASADTGVWSVEREEKGEGRSAKDEATATGTVAPLGAHGAGMIASPVQTQAGTTAGTGQTPVPATGVSDLVNALRQAKAEGLAHIERIVQDSTEGSAEFRRDYLTRNVVYDLGDREKQGLRRFQQYLKEMGLIETAHDLRYIS
jgi:hypothetical protein